MLFQTTLFNSLQSSCVHTFNASVGNSSDLDSAILDVMVGDAKVFYDSLGHHYRVVAQPAALLDHAQSHKVSFQVSIVKSHILITE